MNFADSHTEIFESQRPALRGLAYRMTGSAAEAEDLVQEAYLRWCALEPLETTHDAVRQPGAYLKTIVARLCIDHQRSARVRRERYVGPWLPEPVLDRASVTPESASELAQDVSIALLLALDRLSPLERAAFLLKDVFDVDYEEVASAIGREPTACRKLVERARQHVRSARPRRAPSPEESERVISAFYQALSAGDAEALLRVLSEDCVLTTDGGGRVRAALKPIVGGDKVARFFLGMARKVPLEEMTVTPTAINGLPGALVQQGSQLDQTIAFQIDEGRIVAIYTVRNPDKLRHLRT